MANKNAETREDATQLERQLNRIRYMKHWGDAVSCGMWGWRE